MRVSDATLAAMLKKAGKITDEDLVKLEAEAKKTAKPLQDLVITHEIVKDEELTQLYAKETGVPYIKLDPKAISRKTINLLPERIARQYNAVVFDVKAGVKYLAMDDPDDVQGVDFIQKYIGAGFKLYVATR